MNVNELLSTVVPFVQNYRPGNKLGKNGEDKTGIDYSTWEDNISLHDCTLGKKQLNYKEKNDFFRANFSKKEDETAYRHWKLMNGIMFYPSIIPSRISVRKEFIKSHTGVMTIDVDEQDNQQLFSDPELLDITFKNLWVWLDYLFLRTKSVGSGFVFYAYVNIPGDNGEELNENNKIVYERVKQDFLRFGIVIDANCANINRGRFIAYDDEPWVKEDVEQLVLDEKLFQKKIIDVDEDYLSHSKVKGWVLSDGFNVSPEDTNYVRWWQIWRNMFHYFGYDNAKIEFEKYCRVVDKVSLENGWDHYHTWDHMFHNAIGGDRANSQIDWNPNINMLRGIGYSIEETVEDDKITLREYFENQVEAIPEGSFMLDYKDKILSFWKDHPRMMMVAGTGNGKTILIKWISHTRKCLVIVPYNDMLSIYKCNDKHKVTGDIIVKGVTNILSSEDPEGINEFDGSKSACIIWDQLKRIEGKISDYDIIVDECHVEGKSSTFRGSSSYLNKFLHRCIDRGQNVMFVTATPTLEQEEYDLRDSDIIKFDRQGSRQRSVEICYGMLDEYPEDKKEESEPKITPGKALQRIVGDVSLNNKTGWYKYILIWSDDYNMILTDTLISKGIPVHQVSKRAAKYSKVVRDEMNRLKETETLLPGIYTFTQLTENGFNFNNDDGSAKIIIQVKRKDFSAAKIIQIIGRLRNMKYVSVKVYIENERDPELTPEEKYIRANMLEEDNIQLHNNPLYKDENVVRKVDDIEKYEEIHGTPEKLKEDLELYLSGGRFRVSLHDMSGETRLKRGSRKNKVKVEQENETWENMKNPEWFPESIHGKELYWQAKSLFDEYGENSIRTWVELLKTKSKSDKMISTCLTELRKNIPWLNEDFKEEQVVMFNERINSKEEITISGKTYEIPYKLKQVMIKELQEHLRWTERYEGCVTVDDCIEYDKSTLFEELEVKKVRLKNTHSKPRTKKLLMVVADGFVGTTEDVMEHIGKNRDTVTRWKKNGKIINISDNQ